jgi:DNA polymerase-1
MSKQWILVDANFLCYRAFHTMGHLSHGDIRTGVLFGVLRDIVGYQDFAAGAEVAFCFDYGKSLRYDMCPTYKQERKRQRALMSEEDQAARKELRTQINTLRRELLPELGYRNVFYQKRYEADDVIASIVNELPEDERALIISADEDLYQLINHNVRMWNPNLARETTLQDFYKKYGILPAQWSQVKAIAGCSSDCIPGIPRVGETTAIKFLKGELPKHHKTFEAITNGPGVISNNLKLTSLPLPGCNTFRLRSNRVTHEKWDKVVMSLGMKSLRRLAPIPSREAGRRHGARKRQGQ